MIKLIFMIGIAGSGKSFWAKKIAKQEKAIIVSTDEIRQENGSNINLIFKIAYEKIAQFISQGQSVIFDATNIDADKRIKALSKFEGIVKECYYLDTPYSICTQRNNNRKRKVQENIIKKMSLNIHFPIVKEGWDKIHIIHEPNNYGIIKDDFIDLIQKELSYNDLFDILKYVPIFQEMINFNQENPHHQYVLCEHTYLVLDYVNNFYSEEDKLQMQVAALFHDIGKPFCKVFKLFKGYYSYYGHEYVSTQIACSFLKELGFDDDFIYKTLNFIQMHMKINHGGDEAASEIFKLLGDEYLWKMYFFKEADVFAR